MHALRETIESIVIAFVLAFLFRTFEAEAFQIPTGSMSPSLQGQHKDVDCSECGYRFRVSASDEQGERAQKLLSTPGWGTQGNLRSLQTVGGICPMCRQTMPMREDLPEGPDGKGLDSDDQHKTYWGDRILVNKYSYCFKEPERWDVVVFKNPGNGEMNYIKRLVGLPEEQLQLYQGDVFVRPLNSNTRFEIERKPPNKVAAMLQPVHDTDYDSSLLYRAGWPLRWTASEGASWRIEAEPGELTVDQTMSIDATEQSEPQWLRYRHYVPTFDDWTIARQLAAGDKSSAIDTEAWQQSIQPRLILDFNSYNTTIYRGGGTIDLVSEVRGLEVDGWTPPDPFLPFRSGLNWVSDLAVEAEIEVRDKRGALLLDLVEGGKHFTCTIDLDSGQATFSIDDLDDFSPQATTPVQGTGSYNVRFANVDDQLLLWVDGDLVEFEDSTYDVAEVFGGRERIIPRSSEADLGDLAPAAVGSDGAHMSVSRLRVFKDIFYIAVNVKDQNGGQKIFDFEWPHRPARGPDDERIPAVRSARALFADPEAWARFSTRERRNFDLEEDQFFVMGDNSPASLDCRLWYNKGSRSYPGGPYLDRRMLTGKAVCVFWPHSWGSIPGLKFLPGFPNFGDMRIVR